MQEDEHLSRGTWTLNAVQGVLAALEPELYLLDAEYQLCQDVLAWM
jgi:hypothetical protein